MKQHKHLFIIPLFIFLMANVSAQVPDIVKVDKVSGSFREFVTISGSGFSNNSTDLSVHFGASKGHIVNATEFLIEVLAPAGATYNNISVTNLQSKSTGYAKPFFNLAFEGSDFEETRIKESLRINEEIALFDMCNCDFNGDGLNDVATTNNSDDASATSISVYQNLTTDNDFEIKFQRINEVNLNIGKAARNITCGDLDGDGKPELVVGKGGGNADRIYIFKNVSTTGIRFNTPITVLLSENVSSSTTRRLKIHDLDKDGKPDIIMTDQGEGKVFIFANKSSGNGISFPAEFRQKIQTTAGSLVGLDVADFNNDNKPEIVCNSDKSDVFLIPNESVAGTIKMGTPFHQTITGANLVNIKIGDLDLDGDNDIALTNYVNNIYILVNSGNADDYSFGTPKYIETGRLPWGIDIGDLNGDGLPDIIVATTDASEKVTALINTSTGSTPSYSPYYIGNADISFNLNISDFSGDGKPDIGYIESDNEKLVFLRNMNCVVSEILPKNPAPICSNKPVTLRTTPALKVDYVWTNTTTDQVITGDITAEITEAGSYNVSIQSAGDGCESVSQEVTLTDGGDNLPPTVVVTNPGVVCEGDNFKLTAELVGGVNYVWLTPNGDTFQGNELSVDNSTIEDGGRYALVLESAGCRTDPSFELVEISTIPAMEISSSAGALFCEGTTNELSVPYLTDAQYEWKFNDNVIPGVTANTYSTTNSGNYAVFVRNSNNCTGNSNTISIKEVKQPVASFGEVTSSCLNEHIQFENTSTYDATETPVFNWDFGDATTSTDKNPTHTYQEPGEFRVILEVSYNNTTCSDVYENTISVAAFLDLDIMADGNPVPDGIFNLCEGNTAELSVEASPGQVEWSTGETTPKITIKDPGIYSVISGKNTGCSSSDEIEAVLVDNINLEIISGSQRIESGSSAQLEAAGADFYLWEPADDLDDPNISNPLASPIITTEYTVNAWNSYGCEDFELVTVYVDEAIVIQVEAPLAFSPNGDGQNDEWKIKNIDVYESCPVRIFNRRGQNVYEAGEYNNDWNGIFNGVELPEGAYYYIITCNTSEVHTGSITLIR